MRVVVYMLIGWVMALMGGCGYNNFGDYKPTTKETLPANIDIAEIKALYKGKPLVVKDDVVMSGWVTANDYSGNFYRTFIIEDKTGAIEIKAGLYNLHNTHPEGKYVAIKAKGLTVGEFDGLLQIGLPSAEGGSYQTDYFGYKAILEDYVTVGDEINHIAPMLLTLRELDVQMCGRLVKVDNLKLLESPTITWATSKDETTDAINGYALFADESDNKIVVTTSGYADFASKVIPLGKVSITGILLYGKTPFGKHYMIKMRTEDDCKEL